MSEIIEGSVAPDLRLPNENGDLVALSDYRESQVVLYFYPKDDTSGCTKEAIAFSGLLDEFKSQNTVILGVSPDTAAKHTKFKAKHDLTVTLLADEEKELAQAFGVWVEKSMYGKKYMGVERSTFLIDKGGKVAKVWRKVKVAGHAEAVLEAAKEVNAG